MKDLDLHIQKVEAWEALRKRALVAGMTMPGYLFYRKQGNIQQFQRFVEGLEKNSISLR